MKNSDYLEFLVLIEDILQKGDSKRVTTEGHSYQFALTAIKSALFINAGSLIALPAYKELLSNIYIIFPSLLFSLGIISSALSLYASYINLQHYAEREAAAEYVRANEKIMYFEKENDIFNKEREDQIISMKSKISYYNEKINKYLRWATILGFASYALFIGGFICAGYKYIFNF